MNSLEKTLMYFNEENIKYQIKIGGLTPWLEKHRQNLRTLFAEAEDKARAATNTPVPHSDDIAIDRFAQAMKAKMRVKRGAGRGGWEDPVDCPQELLSQMLREHVDKGDPVDVGNLAMMHANRNERILPDASGQAIISSHKLHVLCDALIWYQNAVTDTRADNPEVREIARACLINDGGDRARMAFETRDVQMEPKGEPVSPRLEALLKLPNVPA